MVGAIRNSLSYIVASPFMALRQLFDDKMRNHGQFLAEGERPYCIFSCSVSLYQACCRMCSDKDSTRASRPEVPSSLRKYCTSSEKRTTYPFVRDLVILPAAAVGEENIAGGRYTRPEGRHFSASCWSLQKPCKQTCFPLYAFPSIAGYLPGLLHRCDGLHPHKVREDRYSPSRLEPAYASFVLGACPAVCSRCSRLQRAKQVRIAYPTARNAQVPVKIRRL
jgi:hypothetical protein